MGSDLKPIPTERLVVNIGPSHPITHGTLRIQVELDGERIARAGCEIGYLHRGFEKEAENCYYQYVVPYAERMNYMGPVHNSNAWCHAVEELVGISERIPARAQAIRVIMPPTGNQYLNLLKNTSLAIAVGYSDIVQVGTTVFNQTGMTLPVVSIWMLFYLSCSLTISVVVNWFNVRMRLVER